MSKFAKVVNGKVEKVIVAEYDFFNNFIDESPGRWIKTSYNIRGGVYYDPETNQPHQDQSLISEDEGRQRKNYAGIGYSYDKERDAFIPPQPFQSWTLNEDSCLWDPPTPYPEDGQNYLWNEEEQNWDLA